MPMLPTSTIVLARSVPNVLLCLGLALPLPAQSRTAAPTDQQIFVRVEHLLSGEPAFTGLSIVPSVKHGTVTLDGVVDSQAAKKLASAEVGSIRGVRGVLNNLDVRTTPGPQALPPPTVIQAQGLTVKPQDTTRVIILPANTTITLRLTGEINTKTARDGDTFHGSTAANIGAAGYTLIPLGSLVTGRVVSAKEAGHFSGSAELVLELTSVRLSGQSGSPRPQEVSLVTSEWSNKAAGRGGNTVEKTGGGAAAGAIIGALAGGGRGAGIGAASGGALGAGANAITRGKEIVLKPEQILQFHTTGELPVTVYLHNGIQTSTQATAPALIESRTDENAETQH